MTSAGDIKEWGKELDALAEIRSAYQSQKGLMVDDNTKHVFNAQISRLESRYLRLGLKLDGVDPNDAPSVSAFQAARKELRSIIEEYDILWLNKEINLVDKKIKQLQLQIESGVVERKQPQQGECNGVTPPHKRR
jgi:hypothetical protein